MAQPRRATIVHRSDRCDECRRRKRGCDKAKPACSGCVDRNVKCVYSRLASPFINLHASVVTSTKRVRELVFTDQTPEITGGATSTRSAKPRHGPLTQGLSEHQALTVSQETGRAHVSRVSRNQQVARYPQASYHVQPVLMHDEAKLGREMYDILHSGSSRGSHMHLWGDWLEYVPQRVSMTRDTLLVQAVACMILGHRALYTHYSSKTIALGRRCYGQALMSMRQSVAAKATVTIDMIAAVRMLMMFELLIGSGFAGWLSHANGYDDLFLILGPKSCEGDFERALFHASHTTAWQQALMEDKPSRYDQPGWLNIPPPNGISTCYSIAEKLVSCRVQATVRLPRLISLVRKIRNNPEDALNCNKAIELASEILDLIWVEDVALQPELLLQRTSNEEDAVHVPFSICCGEQDFHKLIQQATHWSSKIVLGGLCEILYVHGVPMSWPSFTEIRDVQRICADSICMTIEMAARLTPYGPIRLYGPMFVAWGAYYRQHHIAGNNHMYAKMEWLRRRGNALLKQSEAEAEVIGVQDFALIFMNERLQGGPLSPAEYLARSRVADDAHGAKSPQSHSATTDSSSSRASSVEIELKQKARENAMRKII